MGRPHHFFNNYLTATVSVALVLCLVGFECVLLLSAGTLVHRVKENVAMTVVLKEDVDSVRVQSIEQMLDAASYCSAYRYISKEEALEEHIALLGEDPTKFLGYNPLSASVEIHPSELYANPDSMSVLEQKFSSLPYVDRVIYQRDLVQLLNSNVSQAAIILMIVAVVLLLIAVVLIVNTIRLQIYSKRFLINTMTLVGATPHVIRSPFIRKNMLLGAIASLIAIIVIGLVVYYVNRRLGVILFPLTWQNICIIVGVVFASGLLLTLVASQIATSRYLRMSLDSLYEI